MNGFRSESDSPPTQPARDRRAIDDAGRDEAIAFLQQSALFAGVPLAEVELACSYLTLVTFSAGETLVQARELGNTCYILRTGQGVVVSDDLIGQEAVISTVGPGAIIGEIALLRDVLRVATVRATTEISAYVIDRADFLRLAEQAVVFSSRLRRRVDLADRVRFLRRASPLAGVPDDLGAIVAEVLRPVQVQAGEVVLREGDAGDCFYLVRSGRLDVRRSGRPIQELSTGDYFGEAAILSNSPRNATVVARADGELLALQRPAFVALLEEYPRLRAHVEEMSRLRGRGNLAPANDVAATHLADLVLPARRGPFWLTFAVGLLLFVVLGDLARSTNRADLSIATVVVGSLVGPITYVVYLATANILTRQPLRLLVTFLIAAAGLPLAVQAELATGALNSDLSAATVYAIVEEAVKVIGVFWLLRRADMRFQMDGIIYGAAAGMGFSAIETLLYGLQNLGSMSQLLTILWLRALLSPFTHGTWTAIICAAIWRSKGSGLPRWDWRVLVAFAVSVTLHTAWDWSPIHVYLYYYYLAIGVVGFIILGLLVRQAQREQTHAVVALNPELLATASTSPRVQARCLRCGQVAPAGAHYCPRCGVALRVS